MTNTPSKLNRRGLILGAGAATAGFALASTDTDAKSAREINIDVDYALRRLFRSVRGSRGLYNRASGVLVIPEVVKAGLVLAGSYGEGALRVGGRTDSYWRYTSASVGFQAGAQRTRQAIFFMTDYALRRFKNSRGFEFGADAEATIINRGAEISVDSTRHAKPVIAIVYGQEGLLGGASLQGGKYDRIRR